jgi:transmembrane 9 superfamily protein 2/4
MTDDQIHWFSIVNSVMIVLFLSGMVAMIMMRTLRSDIAKYNQLDQDDAAEETGWKLVRLRWAAVFGGCWWFGALDRMK